MYVAIMCCNSLGNTKYVKKTWLVFKHLNNKAFLFYIYTLKVERYEDVPAWILTQTKERLTYLQETLSDLTERLLNGPLNWLVGITSRISIPYV